MRRFDQSKHRIGGNATEPPTQPQDMAPPVNEALALHIVLPLKTITPVLGGGVKPWQPDTLDPVRVPAIRGHLRWWWRALCPVAWTAQELFDQETALWGGVTDEEAIRSRVSIRASEVKPGEILAAGQHHYVADRGQGVLKTPPQWEGEYGPVAYALFPLQRDDDARKAYLIDYPQKDMPTHSVTSSLEFKLEISIDLRKDRRPYRDLHESAVRLVHALWSWSHLGGIGARTRRGFGALNPTAEPAFKGALDIVKCAGVSFEMKDLDEYRDHVERLFDKTVRRPLGYLLTRAGRDAAQAQAHAVGALQKFRQGPGIGRATGFGRSHWPEPNMLRYKRGPNHYDPVHALPDDVPKNVCSRTQGTPRAAFGLPLGIRFPETKRNKQTRRKEVNKDHASSGDILPFQIRIAGHSGLIPAEERRRFASPILLRPILIGERAFAIIVALEGEMVETTRIEWTMKANTLTDVPVIAKNGAKDPIHALLQSSEGHALAAFRTWAIRPIGR